jgi:hypothetical protein
MSVREILRSMSLPAHSIDRAPTCAPHVSMSDTMVGVYLALVAEIYVV